MGTWGASCFDNDEALTWITNFCNSPERHLIEDALTIINNSEGEHLTAPYCALAIAAAEVVAALKKAADPQMGGKIGECLVNLELPVDANLVQLAAQAVSRIRTESELKDSWDGSANACLWHASLKDLEERLKQ